MSIAESVSTMCSKAPSQMVHERKTALTTVSLKLVCLRVQWLKHDDMIDDPRFQATPSNALPENIETSTWTSENVHLVTLLSHSATLLQCPRLKVQSMNAHCRKCTLCKLASWNVHCRKTQSLKVTPSRLSSN